MRIQPYSAAYTGYTPANHRSVVTGINFVVAESFDSPVSHVRDDPAEKWGPLKYRRLFGTKWRCVCVAIFNGGAFRTRAAAGIRADDTSLNEKRLRSSMLSIASAIWTSIDQERSRLISRDRFSKNLLRRRRVERLNARPADYAVLVQCLF